MKKVAVFGNTGGGKSTLSIRLPKITGLPLHILDKIQYRSGGESVALEEYNRDYQDLLATDQWIIDGYGSLDVRTARDCHSAIAGERRSDGILRTRSVVVGRFQ